MTSHVGGHMPRMHLEDPAAFLPDAIVMDDDIILSSS